MVSVTVNVVVEWFTPPVRCPVRPPATKLEFDTDLRRISAGMWSVVYRAMVENKLTKRIKTAVDTTILYFSFYIKLKNVSCEYNRLNG